MEALIRQAGRLLGRARRVVVLTGAGISKESGIPTFRDAQDGLWRQYNPLQLASPEGFRANPALVWQWYDHRRQLVEQARPNPAHHALVRLEQLVPHLVIVTQNVDGLHVKAGSTDVIELHGNLRRYRCIGEGHRFAFEDLPDRHHVPPRCPQCDALIRPDVVWFGELLPPSALERAMEESRSCDVMLVVGTSGVVQPAASLPYYAAEQGATLIEINPEPSGITPLAHVFLQGKAGEILPRLVEVVDQQRD